MAGELENAIEESLPQPTQAESSPAQAQPQVVAPVETPTQQVEQEKEPPFHEHPRFKELISEKNQLHQQNQQLMELLQKVQTPQPTQAQEMTPEEKSFWDKNRQFMLKEAEPLIQELKKEIQEQKITTTALIYRDFQQRHPDVKQGSAEEQKIADYFRKGLDLDTAYDAVFAPIKAKQEIEKIKAANQVRTQQKIAANVETTSVSPTAIPTAEPKNFRDRVRESLIKAGF